MMSSPNPFLYAVFHPVAYGVKLIIEITMADLIAKIVRSQQELNSYLSTTNTYITRPDEVRMRDHTADGSGIEGRNVACPVDMESGVEIDLSIHPIKLAGFVPLN
ncbi:hypothetical protein FMUND_15521 [Fusarium mundagurra]|uniref:Uncharacterized protein n=1 Tax=Fusarium mundagurra TaxID=1567541 RepID=A0A8H5XPG4_9HYPO|nr:hypothetical protein FMUND_15521 [Fusarium mundagurra]